MKEELEKLILSWRKEAEQYRSQVQEAQEKGTPFGGMLATMLTFKHCADKLERILRNLN